MKNIESRLKKLEKIVKSISGNTQKEIHSELKRRNRKELQSQELPFLFSALCVNTKDPMAEGQVQYYTPFLTAPGTELSSLPWAYPISPFGGFDDCGVTWVPPAGSKLALLCENADRNQAFYLGTFWYRSRGLPSGSSNSSQTTSSSSDNNRDDLWGISIPEYDALWEGTRDGYNLGPNDGSQVKMPWNTDNYQTKDWDTTKEFTFDPNQNLTNPHQYGMKTPEKHYIKFVDGDPQCNHRFRRAEFASGRGNILMMKDDHLHSAAQWAFSGGSSAPTCYDSTGSLYEYASPNENTSCGSNNTSDEFSNPYFKRKEEMRFYQPVPALAQYQNNKCELKQSGIQLQSISGQQLVMDDSVDQPEGEPRWNLDFSFGCNDVYKGKFFLRSATGHMIEMNDQETDTYLRDESNGINLITALGNKIIMSDHTLGSKGSPENAGDKRGIFMQSTANHILEFHDEGNTSPVNLRKAGGEPQALADNAYVLLRSGYGAQLLFSDSSSQQETKNQFVQLLSPQKDNKTRGPHHLIMQEEADGAGLVMLRAGGVYHQFSYDDSMEVVGDGKKEGGSNKFVTVSGSYTVDVKKTYFNHNELTIFQSDKYIVLYAGLDCQTPTEESIESSFATANSNIQIAQQSQRQGTPNQLPLDKSPCTWPVIVGKDPFICPFTNFVHFGVMNDPTNPTRLMHNSLSDRVFASASMDEPTKLANNITGAGQFGG